MARPSVLYNIIGSRSSRRCAYVADTYNNKTKSFPKTNHRDVLGTGKEAWLMEERELMSGWREHSVWQNYIAEPTSYRFDGGLKDQESGNHSIKISKGSSRG